MKLIVLAGVYHSILAIIKECITTNLAILYTHTGVYKYNYGLDAVY